MTQLTQRFWLSFALLFSIYATFGWFLHLWQVSQLTWALVIIFVVLKAGVLTVLWKSTREFVLLGFQSDMGYLIMVLLLASLFVTALVWLQVFAYILMIVAAGLLVRVDLLTQSIDDVIAFATLLIIPLLALAASWLPLILASRGVG
ncbi:MAG: hypothetical protein HC886_06660 [Leptolyngbyaceae cyanobacterium SM1_1_3]|nr:hypothetical protein [Leptolyngbyaceae cyanobacterium SM1_1_3]NJN01690.1 hypothetical protein [Leptolyngbyaceae cyanobacterium RM1_1_2]NJO11315.1 hypothetical protein [Leptolyngbyaceae cyanobacterium SL_1_1]